MLRRRSRWHTICSASGEAAREGWELSEMLLREFLNKIERHPNLELVYCDPTMCILRCRGQNGERRIRLGLWAVRRMRWEQIVEAFHLPLEVAS